MTDDSAPNAAAALNALRHAMRGPGDSRYAEFNAFARKLDPRLAEVGALRLMERIEADLQFDETYEEWERRVFPLLALPV